MSNKKNCKKKMMIKLYCKKIKGDEIIKKKSLNSKNLHAKCLQSSRIMVRAICLVYCHYLDISQLFQKKSKTTQIKIKTIRI